MIITPATLITPEGYPQIYEKVKTLMLEIKEEYFGESPYLETMIISKFLEILTCVGRQRVNAHTVAGQQKENGANSRQKEYVEKFILVTDYINNHFAEDFQRARASRSLGSNFQYLVGSSSLPRKCSFCSFFAHHKEYLMIGASVRDQFAIRIG